LGDSWSHGLRLDSWRKRRLRTLVDLWLLGLWNLLNLPLHHRLLALCRLLSQRNLSAQRKLLCLRDARCARDGLLGRELSRLLSARLQRLLPSLDRWLLH
jgi:hypothetical protein